MINKQIRIKSKNLKVSLLYKSLISIN